MVLSLQMFFAMGIMHLLPNTPGTEELQVDIDEELNLSVAHFMGSCENSTFAQQFFKPYQHYISGLPFGPAAFNMPNNFAATVVVQPPDHLV